VSVDESLPLRPCFEALVVPPRRIEIVGGWKRSGDFNEPPQCFWNATVDGADKKTTIADEGFSRHSPILYITKLCSRKSGRRTKREPAIDCSDSRR
jgi:hypothetical protein